VAILSSTGIFGAALLFGFILRLYILRCPGPDPETKEFAIALKFALVPYFAMMAVAGSTPDFGFGAAAVMGLLASLTATRSRPSPGHVRAGGGLFPGQQTYHPVHDVIMIFGLTGVMPAFGTAT
jgi:hypothetical protein